MSHYNWNQYNISNLKLSKKLIKFNKKYKINYIEKGLYNHVRDLFCTTLVLRSNVKKKINLLDYGSNLLALSNIISKIKVKQYNFYIFDPFSKKNKVVNKPFKISFLTKSFHLKKRKFHIVNFGSSLQYLTDINDIKKELNFKTIHTIIITNTPITLKKKYISKQSNHQKLIQSIHSLKKIKKFFENLGFRMVFISRNDDKYVACKTKKNGTYSLNLLFIKN
tara:strand:+ start:511 stop:1176 length:666 start_codon:yes stop_codon:yes gene_type:complete